MREITAESFFGINAGIVWRALNQNGPTNIRNLAKSTSLSREEVLGALGWLGRENKVLMEQKGRAMVFSLREGDAGPAAREEVALETDTRAKSRRSKRIPAKRAKKASEARTPATEASSPIKEAQIGQDEMIKEFLLH